MFLYVHSCTLRRSGTDVTVIGWGGQMRVLEKACEQAQTVSGISCELIGIRSRGSGGI
jgi:2-oxoisovalerate dehydrogenase E1 component beta subunit